MTKKEFILDYLAKKTFMSSWDWDADFAYAKEFYPELDGIGGDLESSDAVLRNKLAVHSPYFGKVKRDRLKVLRELVKENLVESSWVGTGHGGAAIYGITRNKCYNLKLS